MLPVCTIAEANGGSSPCPRARIWSLSGPGPLSGARLLGTWQWGAGPVAAAP
jgi:hypothetical protein